MGVVSYKVDGAEYEFETLFDEVDDIEITVVCLALYDYKHHDRFYTIYPVELEVFGSRFMVDLEYEPSSFAVRVVEIKKGEINEQQIN